jgi:hypothetical protein
VEDHADRLLGGWSRLSKDHVLVNVAFYAVTRVQPCVLDAPPTHILAVLHNALKWSWLVENDYILLCDEAHIHLQTDGDDREASVLVPVRQIGKMFEREKIPTFLRLYAFEPVAHCVADPVLLDPRRDASTFVERSAGALDRELELVVPVGWVLALVIQGDLVQEIVETTAEPVDDIAGVEAPLGVRLVQNGAYSDVAPRTFLDSETTEVLPLKGGDARVECLQLGIRSQKTAHHPRERVIAGQVEHS